MRKICHTANMEITQKQYEQIADCFHKQRGNVKYDNLNILNAVLYVAENGCKWRGLPQRFGNWHTVCTGMSRRIKNGVPDRIFERLQYERFLRIGIEAVSSDSTYIKVHPDGMGASKKGGDRRLENPEEDGPPKFIWLLRVPVGR